VTWSVVSGGGTINSYGLYTAPANATACQVQATSQAAPAVSGQAAVTVDLVGVSISPTAVTLDQGVVQPFTAQLAGATVSSGVLWQVVGSGGGSVDADGNYTAGTTAGTDYVNVYSQEDRTKVATATVTVNPPPGFTLSLPASLTVQQGDTVTAPITVNPTYGFTGTVAFTVPPISGTGFANSCSPSASSSKTTLSVTATPTQAAGTYDQSVTGTCGNLTVSGTVPVTVTAQNPVITSVAPSAGVPGGGTAVTITGTGLGTVSGVTFGGIASDFICVVSSKEVISNSPAGTLGTVDIQVANATGVRSALNLNEQFTYMFLPAVSSMIPDFGPLSGGTMIVLNGSDFTGATGVNFGTIPASFFHVYNDNEMITASPAITGGIASVPVTVLNEAGASATSAATTFTYYVAPIVTGVSPSSGNVAGGDQVTLTGSNFFGATAVMFGTTAAASYTVAGNTIIAVTPAESAGAVDITVTNPSYTSATSASDTFTFTN
jgi:hypothetical protein